MNSRDAGLLLSVGRASIEEGLRSGRPLRPELEAFPSGLRESRATFVTLRRDGALRGCTGSLEAVRPLVADVALHAFSSAFSDPRFAPLSSGELAGLDLHVAILSPPAPLRAVSEAELIGRLRPGVDGLILRENGRTGTFLPAVWESLPDPRAFLRALKEKAGLPPDHWSDRIEVERYTTETIP